MIAKNKMLNPAAPGNSAVARLLLNERPRHAVPEQQR